MAEDPPSEPSSVPPLKDSRLATVRDEDSDQHEKVDATEEPETIVLPMARSFNGSFQKRGETQISRTTGTHTAMPEAEPPVGKVRIMKENEGGPTVRQMASPPPSQSLVIPNDTGSQTPAPEDKVPVVDGPISPPQSPRGRQGNASLAGGRGISAQPAHPEARQKNDPLGAGRWSSAPPRMIRHGKNTCHAFDCLGCNLGDNFEHIGSKPKRWRDEEEDEEVRDVDTYAKSAPLLLRKKKGLRDLRKAALTGAPSSSDGTVIGIGASGDNSIRGGSPTRNNEKDECGRSPENKYLSMVKHSNVLKRAGAEKKSERNAAGGSYTSYREAMKAEEIILPSALKKRKRWVARLEGTVKEVPTALPVALNNPANNREPLHLSELEPRNTPASLSEDKGKAPVAPVAYHSFNAINAARANRFSGYHTKRQAALLRQVDEEDKPEAEWRMLWEEHIEQAGHLEPPDMHFPVRVQRMRDPSIVMSSAKVQYSRSVGFSTRLNLQANVEKEREIEIPLGYKFNDPAFWLLGSMGYRFKIDADLKSPSSFEEPLQQSYDLSDLMRDTENAPIPGPFVEHSAPTGETNVRDLAHETRVETFSSRMPSEEEDDCRYFACASKVHNRLDGTWYWGDDSFESRALRPAWEESNMERAERHMALYLPELAVGAPQGPKFASTAWSVMGEPAVEQQLRGGASDSPLGDIRQSADERAALRNSTAPSSPLPDIDLGDTEDDLVESQQDEASCTKPATWADMVEEELDATLPSQSAAFTITPSLPRDVKSWGRKPRGLRADEKCKALDGEKAAIRAAVHGETATPALGAPKSPSRTSRGPHVTTIATEVSSNASNDGYVVAQPAALGTVLPAQKKQGFHLQVDEVGSSRASEVPELPSLATISGPSSGVTLHAGCPIRLQHSPTAEEYSQAINLLRESITEEENQSFLSFEDQYSSIIRRSHWLSKLARWSDVHQAKYPSSAQPKGAMFWHRRRHELRLYKDRHVALAKKTWLLQKPSEPNYSVADAPAPAQASASSAAYPHSKAPDVVPMEDLESGRHLADATAQKLKEDIDRLRATINKEEERAFSCLSDQLSSIEQRAVWLRRLALALQLWRVKRNSFHEITPGDIKAYSEHHVALAKKSWLLQKAGEANHSVIDTPVTAQGLVPTAVPEDAAEAGAQPDASKLSGVFTASAPTIYAPVPTPVPPGYARTAQRSGNVWRASHTQNAGGLFRPLPSGKKTAQPFDTCARIRCKDYLSPKRENADPSSELDLHERPAPRVMRWSPIYGLVAMRDSPAGLMPHLLPIVTSAPPDLAGIPAAVASPADIAAYSKSPFTELAMSPQQSSCESTWIPKETEDWAVNKAAAVAIWDKSTHTLERRRQRTDIQKDKQARISEKKRLELWRGEKQDVAELSKDAELTDKKTPQDGLTLRAPSASIPGQLRPAVIRRFKRAEEHKDKEVDAVSVDGNSKRSGSRHLLRLERGMDEAERKLRKVEARFSNMEQTPTVAEPRRIGEVPEKKVLGDGMTLRGGAPESGHRRHITPPIPLNEPWAWLPQPVIGISYRLVTQWIIKPTDDIVEMPAVSWASVHRRDRFSPRSTPIAKSDSKDSGGGKSPIQIDAAPAPQPEVRIPLQSPGTKTTPAPSSQEKETREEKVVKEPFHMPAPMSVDLPPHVEKNMKRRFDNGEMREDVAAAIGRIKGHKRNTSTVCSVRNGSSEDVRRREETPVTDREAREKKNTPLQSSSERARTPHAPDVAHKALVDNLSQSNANARIEPSSSPFDAVPVESDSGSFGLVNTLEANDFAPHTGFLKPQFSDMLSREEGECSSSSSSSSVDTNDLPLPNRNTRRETIRRLDAIEVKKTRKEAIAQRWPTYDMIEISLNEAENRATGLKDLQTAYDSTYLTRALNLPCSAHIERVRRRNAPYTIVPIAAGSVSELLYVSVWAESAAENFAASHEDQKMALLEQRRSDLHLRGGAVETMVCPMEAPIIAEFRLGVPHYLGFPARPKTFTRAVGKDPAPWYSGPATRTLATIDWPAISKPDKISADRLEGPINAADGGPVWKGKMLLAMEDPQRGIPKDDPRVIVSREACLRALETMRKTSDPVIHMLADRVIDTPFFSLVHRYSLGNAKAEELESVKGYAAEVDRILTLRKRLTQCLERSGCLASDMLPCSAIERGPRGGGVEGGGPPGFSLPNIPELNITSIVPHTSLHTRQPQTRTSDSQALAWIEQQLQIRGVQSWGYLEGPLEQLSIPQAATKPVPQLWSRFRGPSCTDSSGHNRILNAGSSIVPASLSRDWFTGVWMKSEPDIGYVHDCEGPSVEELPGMRDTLGAMKHNLPSDSMIQSVDALYSFSLPHVGKGEGAPRDIKGVEAWDAFMVQELEGFERGAQESPPTVLDKSHLLGDRNHFSHRKVTATGGKRRLQQSREACSVTSSALPICSQISLRTQATSVADKPEENEFQSPAKRPKRRRFREIAVAALGELEFRWGASKFSSEVAESLRGGHGVADSDDEWAPLRGGALNAGGHGHPEPEPSDAGDEELLSAEDPEGSVPDAALNTTRRFTRHLAVSGPSGGQNNIPLAMQSRFSPINDLFPMLSPTEQQQFPAAIAHIDTGGVSLRRSIEDIRQQLAGNEVPARLTSSTSSGHLSNIPFRPREEGEEVADITLSAHTATARWVDSTLMFFGEHSASVPTRASSAARLPIAGGFTSSLRRTGAGPSQSSGVSSTNRPLLAELAIRRPLRPTTELNVADDTVSELSLDGGVTIYATDTLEGYIGELVPSAVAVYTENDPSLNGAVSLNARVTLEEDIGELAPDDFNLGFEVPPLDPLSSPRIPPGATPSDIGEASVGVDDNLLQEALRAERSRIRRQMDIWYERRVVADQRAFLEAEPDVAHDTESDLVLNAGTEGSARNIVEEDIGVPAAGDFNLGFEVPPLDPLSNPRIPPGATPSEIGETSAQGSDRMHHRELIAAREAQQQAQQRASYAQRSHRRRRAEERHERDRMAIAEQRAVDAAERITRRRRRERYARREGRATPPSRDPSMDHRDRRLRAAELLLDQVVDDAAAEEAAREAAEGRDFFSIDSETERGASEDWERAGSASAASDLAEVLSNGGDNPLNPRSPTIQSDNGGLPPGGFFNANVARIGFHAQRPIRNPLRPAGAARRNGPDVLEIMMEQHRNNHGLMQALGDALIPAPAIPRENGGRGNFNAQRPLRNTRRPVGAAGGNGSPVLQILPHQNTQALMSGALGGLPLNMRNATVPPGSRVIGWSLMEGETASAPLANDVWEGHQALQRRIDETPMFIRFFEHAFPSARIGGIAFDRQAYIDSLIYCTAASGHGAGERGGVPEGVWYACTFRRRLTVQKSPKSDNPMLRRVRDRYDDRAHTRYSQDMYNSDAESDEDDEFTFCEWEVVFPACAMKDMLRSTDAYWGVKAVRARDWALMEMGLDLKSNLCCEALAEWWERLRGVEAAAGDRRCRKVDVRVLEP